MSESFDVLACPLDGASLIEASAGTGKTWNICGLYMRLLLERDLPVGQILVVTFTNAATAELRERIRSRIVETLRYVRAEGPEGTDAFVKDLVEKLESVGLDAQQIANRLDLALQSFDEAAIFTIHAFCQRALADTPFAAGVPFTLELLPDDRDIVLEVARDFWRTHVSAGDLHPALAVHLAHTRDSPEKYAALLEKRIARPLARLAWPEGIERQAAIDTVELDAAYAQAKATWLAERDAIARSLFDALPLLHKHRYSRDLFETSFAEWDAYFALGDRHASLTRKETQLHVCRASRIAQCTYKGQHARIHAFCTQLDALFEARESLEATLALARLQLVRRLLEFGVDEVRERKRRKRVLGYDDILNNLHRALHAPEGARLAASLRARFPAALVDEFQDTDPVQLGILDSIYGQGEVPLFLVGDPKQAIYSFRNADLHTYLQAASRARHRHTLSANQRSTRELIAAVNALFGANPRAFVLPGLDYHAVQLSAKKRVELADRSTTPRADATVWLLPHAEGRLLARQAAIEAAVDATCAEIARLLRDARRGVIDYDGRALAPGDIAVLVRSHAQGTLIRNALRELDIGSVELSQASVFASKDAEEVERVLLAVLEPTRLSLVRGALATELLGLDASAIEALSSDETRLAQEIDAFQRCRETWLQNGFGVMYRRLLVERGVSERMLARADGERRLTNLLHLGERLHETAALDPAPEALVRWLHAQRGQDAVEDVAQLRLESDRNLVQIVTIHKAKGLEYPVVFCPFIWDGFRRSDNAWPCTYHDANGTAVLDFSDKDHRGHDATARMQLESMAEAVRLLYVALTRASHRCYVVAGCYTTNGNSTKQSTRKVLNWIVAGHGSAPEAWLEKGSSPDRVLDAWSAVAESSQRALHIGPLPLDAPQRLAPDVPPAASLSARTLTREIPRPWRISSYTGLSLDLSGERAVADHDVHEIATIDAGAPPEVPSDDILGFPRGPLAGECLHAVLEHVDFTDARTWPGSIDRALLASPYRDEHAHRRRIERMLHDVLGTPLPNGARLRDVPLSRRLTELEFSLPAPRLGASALNAMLARRGYAVPRLAFGELEGYLKGFIDLVFEHEGRFYIVDWKSNHLGYRTDHYAGPGLERAMTEHGYHLQHLLYALALHRYLGRRMRGYRFETHFGGALYLFVRGVRPAWTTPEGSAAGVYFHRVPVEVLQELDAALGHGAADPPRVAHVARPMR